MPCHKREYEGLGPALSLRMSPEAPALYTVRQKTVGAVLLVTSAAPAMITMSLHVR